MVHNCSPIQHIRVHYVRTGLGHQLCQLVHFDGEKISKRYVDPYNQVKIQFSRYKLIYVLTHSRCMCNI